tara:strand:+ start:3197 stop:3763 length:567 start_codon:yes stop_codon:yes gene_type:complete
MRSYYTILDDVVMQDYGLGNEFNEHSFSEDQKNLLKAIQDLPFETQIISDWHDTETYDDGTIMEVRYRCFREVESGNIRLSDQTRLRKPKLNDKGEPEYLESTSFWEDEENDDWWTEFSKTKSPFEIIFTFSNYFNEVYRKRSDFKQIERHTPRLNFLIDLAQEIETLDPETLPKNHYKRVIKEKLSM